MSPSASLALALASACDAATARSLLATVTVRRPARPAQVWPSYLANASAVPVASQELSAWFPAEPDGCSPFEVPAYPTAVVVHRGNCTFAQKASNAQSAGAAGLIVVWDSSKLNSMTLSEELTIFAVSVQKQAEDSLKDSFVSVAPFVRPRMDWVEPLIVAWATGLIALGAFVSTADLRAGSPLAPAAGEVVELSKEMAVAICAVGSGSLLALFYLMRYLVHAVRALFCISGFGCTWRFCSLCLPYLFPSTRQTVALQVTRGDLLAVALAAAPVWCWLVSEYQWIFQDILGVSTLCMMQRSMQIPSIRIAALLLGLMFFYDIFWVFISPYFFRKSVMVEVAQGADTGQVMPMVFRFPSVSDPFSSERILGFGDIVLPGLLVSHLLRHDVRSKKQMRNGYFVPAVLGYSGGLSMAMLAVALTHRGQPALLYLVPMTLGTPLLLAWRRQELGQLWKGEVATHSD